MKRSLVGGIGVAATLLMAFGATAHANPYDPYAGMTYEQAQQKARGKGVIATRVGEFLPTEQCIVTGTRATSFADSSGNSSGKLLFDLNCNDPMTSGHPGYSAATPQGQKAAQLRDTAAKLSSNFEKATEAGKDPYCAENADRCAKICEQAGTCSAALTDYLGL